jgi:hypothetical protein
VILFIAPNPFKTKKREGFLQRVAAIDSLFVCEEKIYYDDVDDDDKFADYLLDATIIYVHSVYNANKILRFYPQFASKIITDLHGIVPEEEEYADNQELARVMQATEKDVFKYGKYFVSVSNAMVVHFTIKYNLKNVKKWIVLPIFDGSPVVPTPKNKTCNNKVIYAGGTQNWQNVDLMVDTINSSSNKYSFTILTHDTQAFSGIGECASKRTIVKQVESNLIANYYKQAGLGFILRDDMILNRVACPTKLIEYLAHGVVPIVLCENIGDFATMGYSFLTLDDFNNDSISIVRLRKSVENNYKVYQAFIEQVKKGQDDLSLLVSSISKPRYESHTVPFSDYVDANMKLQHINNKVIKYEYQIEVYIRKISEYAEAADYYKNQLATIEKRSNSNLRGFNRFFKKKDI